MVFAPAELTCGTDANIRLTRQRHFKRDCVRSTSRSMFRDTEPASLLRVGAPRHTRAPDYRKSVVGVTFLDYAPTAAVY